MALSLSIWVGLYDMILTMHPLTLPSRNLENLCLTFLRLMRLSHFSVAQSARIKKDAFLFSFLSHISRRDQYKD